MNSVVNLEKNHDLRCRQFKNIISQSMIVVRFITFFIACFIVCFVASFIFSFFIVASGIALGQTIERNPAEIIISPQVSSLPGEDSALAGNVADATFLGADLIGIKVVPRIDAASKKALSSPGLHVGAMPLLNTPQGRAVLAPFLGRPLSQKLIADIRIAVTRYYRSQDRALVSVVVPPQEITSGVLQLVVMPYRLGSVAVEGNEWTPSDRILETVRARSGEELDSSQLTSDLNWLNLNPYREVGAVFEPGAKAGMSDLTLRVRERRPWGTYVGYSNTGVPGTDRNRLFVGANVANLPFTDHQLAYQATFSPNAISEDGDQFSLAEQPDYMSHSLSYFAPLPWRHKLNLQASFVESNQVPVVPFRNNGETVLLYGDYGIPLPRFGEILSDLYLGLEYGNQKSRTYFSGTNVISANFEVAQGIIGWRGQRNDQFGWTGFDVRGVLADVVSSGNPAGSPNYAYTYGRLSRSTQLLDTGLTLDTVATAQLANKALPGLERFGVGGWGSVRGYETGETIGDDGFTWSMELHSPQFSILDLAPVKLPIDDVATVSAFWDRGYTRNRHTDESDVLSGVGLGLDIVFGGHLSASLAWGYALTDGPQTAAGDKRIQSQFTARF